MSFDVYVVGYQSVLHRLLSATTLVHSTSPANSIPGANNPEYSGLDSGKFEPEPLLRLGIPPIRSLIMAVPWAIRLGYTHDFLAKQLPGYGTRCGAIAPPPQLQLPVSASAAATDISPVIKEYNQKEAEEVKDPEPKPGSGLSTSNKRSRSAEPANQSKLPAVKNGELCFQWYRAPFEVTVDAKSKEERIQLVYSVQGKGQDGGQCGKIWVAESEVRHLHHR